MEIKEMVAILMDMKTDISFEEVKPGKKRDQKEIDEKLETLDQAIILFEKQIPKAPKGLSFTHEGRVGNCDSCSRLLFEGDDKESCRCGQKVTWPSKNQGA